MWLLNIECVQFFLSGSKMTKKATIINRLKIVLTWINFLLDKIWATTQTPPTLVTLLNDCHNID